MYMNKIILTILFLLVLSPVSFCQNLIPTQTEAVLECIVTDPEKIPEAGARIIVESEDKKFLANSVTDIDGKFKLLIPEGKKYQIKVEKFGQFGIYNIEIAEYADGAELSQSLILKTVKSVRTFTLDHMYFDVNKWEIKKEDYPTLQKLYMSFIKNPKFKIEIGGHTDNVGDEENNHRLSQRRADAIKQYLIQKGISEDRIATKGYGEKGPVASNDTELGRAKNRRTEIKVIEE
jgi:OOP family OmpA-OmpF porin